MLLRRLRCLDRSGAGADEHAQLRQRHRVGHRERHTRAFTRLPGECLSVEARRQSTRRLRRAPGALAHLSRAGVLRAAGGLGVGRHTRQVHTLVPQLLAISKPINYYM